MEDRLHRVFETVNGWLRFAEAKNAVALSVNAAIVATLVRFWPENTHTLWWWWAVIATVFASISAALALLSFAPQIALPFWIRLSAPQQKRNLLFFAHIAHFAPRDYLKAVKDRYSDESAESDGILMDYCEQIVVNARIATRKFALFNVALFLTVAAVATPPGALIAFYYVKRREAAV